MRKLTELMAGIPGASTGLRFEQLRHVMIASFAIALMALIILPIPPVGLDIVIAVNIGSSIVLLMLAIYVPNAMGVSTFPSLILLTTALRLAVNISSTKQILLNARAGDVIETFGELVMGGQVVVGLVVFIIISAVQFIVISKGAERIAEVGARFTLDGLPGRQMSIEADLRADIINAEEAARQRGDLQRESQMHGAMDGAMKFVKGDAIAAIVIALVNIIGGISIGTAVMGMPLDQAVSRFTLLTVGDGMVSQIPSLMSSLAAAILTTRIVGRRNEGSNLGEQISQQVMTQSAALYGSGAVVLLFTLIPGFPVMPFVVLGSSLCLAAWMGRPRVVENRSAGWQVSDSDALTDGSQSSLNSRVIAPLDNTLLTPLQLRMALNLRRDLRPGALQDALARQEEMLQERLGRRLPRMVVRFDDYLPDDTFAVDVQEIESVRGTVVPATDTDERSAEQLIAQNVANVVRSRADAFVGTEELTSVIERFKSVSPQLHGELSRAIPNARLLEVLKRLAEEHVSLRLMREIFELLIVHGPHEKDAVMLAERVRAELGRFIIQPTLSLDRRLRAVVLPLAIEQAIAIAGAKQAKGQPALPGLSADFIAELRAAVSKAIAQFPAGAQPLLLTSLDARLPTRHMLAPVYPELLIVAHAGLPPDVIVEPVARLELPSAVLTSPTGALS